MNELIQTLNARAPDILRPLALMEAQIAMLALLVLAIERLLRQPLPQLRYLPCGWWCWQNASCRRC